MAEPRMAETFERRERRRLETAGPARRADAALRPLGPRLQDWECRGCLGQGYVAGWQGAREVPVKCGRCGGDGIRLAWVKAQAVAVRGGGGGDA